MHRELSISADYQNFDKAVEKIILENEKHCPDLGQCNRQLNLPILDLKHITLDNE